MKIYRIETAAGEGMYSSGGFSGFAVKPEHPAPYEDEGMRDKPSTDRWLYGRNVKRGAVKFGFDSLEQFRQWVSADQETYLAKTGHKIGVYEVNRPNYIRGKHQVIFRAKYAKHLEDLPLCNGDAKRRAA